MKKIFLIAVALMLSLLLIYFLFWIFLYQFKNTNSNSYGLLIRDGSTCSYFSYKVKDCKAWGWGMSPDNNYDILAARCDVIFGRWNVIYSKSLREKASKPTCFIEIENKCTENGEYWFYPRWGQMFIGKFSLFGADQSFAALNLMKK